MSKEVKNRIVTCIVVLVHLLIIFSVLKVFYNWAMGGKNELTNIYGKTPYEVQKVYGEPDSTETRLTGEAAYGYDGWYYIVIRSGEYGLLLEDGSKMIMGISIGDTKRKVAKIMDKNNAYERPTTESDIKIFIKGSYEIFVFFDDNKVITVQLHS